MAIRYMGVDPGQSGGIAVISHTGEIEWLRSMPDTERDIWELVDDIPDEGTRCILEKVWARPGNAAGSTFKFGLNYGFIRACLVAAEIGFTEITPQKWQKGVGVSPKKKTEEPHKFKKRLQDHAQKMFPKAHITLKTCDALLIAEYSRRIST